MKFKGEEQKKSVNITVENIPSAEVKQLLAETIYGAKGKLQYRHNHSAERIAALPHPLFVTIRRRNNLLGTAGFLYRKSSCGMGLNNSWYVRFLSINASSHVKASGRKTIDFIRRRYKAGNGLIKSSLQDTMSMIASYHPGPAVFYAIVEKDNEYSQSLCSSFGFEKVREVKTFLFSRLRPKRKLQAKRMLDKEKHVILHQLSETYTGHSFWFEENVFLNDDYFIYHENEEIVAGIKAMLVSWEIVSLPGFSGFILQKFAGRLPFLNKAINPEKLKFVAFEAPFVKEGKEYIMFDLMETVCAELKANIGMMWMDEGSGFFKRVNNKGSWGFISKLQKPVPTDLLVKFYSVTKEDIEIYKNNPAYISAFDCT